MCPDCNERGSVPIHTQSDRPYAFPSCCCLPRAPLSAKGVSRLASAAFALYSSNPWEAKRTDNIQVTAQSHTPPRHSRSHPPCRDAHVPPAGLPAWAALRTTQRADGGYIGYGGTLQAQVRNDSEICLERVRCLYNRLQLPMVRSRSQMAPPSRLRSSSPQSVLIAACTALVTSSLTSGSCGHFVSSTSKSAHGKRLCSDAWRRPRRRPRFHPWRSAVLFPATPPGLQISADEKTDRPSSDVSPGQHARTPTFDLFLTESAAPRTCRACQSVHGNTCARPRHMLRRCFCE